MSCVQLLFPQHQYYSGRLVTESKLMLLTARQANTSRDTLLGKGIVTLFRKPANREGGGPVSRRTISPKLEFRLLLY